MVFGVNALYLVFSENKPGSKVFRYCGTRTIYDSLVKTVSKLTDLMHNFVKYATFFVFFVKYISKNKKINKIATLDFQIFGSVAKGKSTFFFFWP